MDDFLKKIRKLNWVLSESTTGNLSYEDLSRILLEITEANFYILDNKGKVLGVSYNMAMDSSIILDGAGTEKVPLEHNQKFLEATETLANLKGEAVSEMFGPDYAQKDKLHTLIPCISGGARQGTILLTRYDKEFTDEEIALCEYGATVVGLEIQRNAQLEKARERNLRMSCDMALDTLSFSEKDALIKILDSFEEDETILVASKLAIQYKLTNSVIVNALKKLESAGLLETKSLGMKGTYIRVLNPFLRDAVRNAKI